MGWWGWRSAATMTRRVHGAHRELLQVGPDMLVMVDAGITSGGCVEHVRERGAHVLGALEVGVWEQLDHQRRLADGSVLAWVGPTRPGHAHYPLRRGMWVRIISYRVTDGRVARSGPGLSPGDDPAQCAAGSGARVDRPVS